MATEVTPKSQEVRLGVVMYGGVSLAIYINGVSQEIFRAVQGCGVYKLLKSVLDIDIVVDIISGTSAGGINGLLLAYALGNEKDFATTKELWRVQGDIDKLLYKASVSADVCKSLLDSDGFYRARLAEAFEKLDNSPFVPTNCEPSPLDEMDVFITGTSYEPDVYTALDDAGRAIEMQDYRKVFRLKHRPLRSNPGAFRPERAEKGIRFQALAKLARITSCFPGAFLPVRVLAAGDWQRRDPTLESPPFPASEKQVDALLCEWGGLVRSGYFLDGGVLDNKPFTPTISAIFGRPTDRPVDRILFYVEPDPEESLRPDGVPCAPNFISAVVNGVVGISTYQSVTDDARVLEEHNSAVVRHAAVCRELFGKVRMESSGIGIPPNLEDPQRALYISARNTALASRALRGLLWDSQTGTSEHLTSAADRERVKNLFHSLNEPRDKDEITFDETFRRYDIYFRQRRLQHLVRLLYSFLPGTDKRESESSRNLLRLVNQHVQLLEIIQHWFEYALDRIPVDWRAAELTDSPSSEVWNQIRFFMNQILSIREDLPAWLPSVSPKDSNWLSPQQLDAINEGMRARVIALLEEFKRHPANGAGPGAYDPKAETQFRGFIQWTDEAEAAFFEAWTDDSKIYGITKAEYEGFANHDAIMFPLDFLSNLDSFDEVRLLRISPAPTLDSNKNGSIGFKAAAGAGQKLAGRQLSHFAGFLKRSWRSNDILWGRLDGVRHIVLALITPERIKRLRRDEDLRNEIWNSLGQASGLQALIASSFPQSPTASHDELHSFFSALLLDPSWQPNETNLQSALNLIVEMGQLELINEEIGTVLEDAAAQQADWNRFRTVPAKASAPGAAPLSSFGAPPGFLDPALVGLHVTEKLTNLKYLWKQSAGTEKTPKDTGLGAYFENTYSVATEGVERGIPPLIVVEYLTRTMLVLNACILGALPSKLRDRISSNWFFKLFLDFPLRVSNKLAGLWIREPSLTVISLTSGLFVGLVGLALIFYFSFFQSAATTRLVLAFCAILILLVCWVLLRSRKRLGF
jgi:patatin-related protein